MTTPSTPSWEAPIDAASRKVLTFGLGGDTYGVDILRVHEIRGWSPVTRIAKAPPHVLGVLDRRGAMVPIVDLRVRLGLERAGFTPVTVIIVLSVMTPSCRGEFGLVVDNVADVIDLGAAELKSAPALIVDNQFDFIEGLATVADQMIVLLDIDALIGHDWVSIEPNLLGAA